MLRKRKKNVKYIFLVKRFKIIKTKKYMDMKTWISIVILLFGLTASSQEQKVDFKKINDDFTKQHIILLIMIL